MFSSIQSECSICERPFDEKDQTVTTDCQHIFHRTCAQQRFDTKNRSDCRVCGKESALSDALERVKLIPKEECSICESPLNAEDDIITTDCQHKFHHTCAQQRLDTKNRSDCRVCGKESALANALERAKAVTRKECSICESLLNPDADAVTTECQHTFHRTCAQQRLDTKKRSNCHVCGKESAIGDALIRDKTASVIECSICESLCNAEDDVVTTDCRHTFHYFCAQQRLDSKKRNDCHFCKKESALSNALKRAEETPKKQCFVSKNTLKSQDGTMTTDSQHTIHRTYPQQYLDTKKQGDYHKESLLDKTSDQCKATSGRSTPVEKPFNQAESKRNEKQNQYATSQSTTSSMSKDENNWECMQCSIDNEPSVDRCQSCGTPRSGPLMNTYMAAQGANQDKTHIKISSKLRKSDFLEDKSNFNSSSENIFYPASDQFFSTNVNNTTKVSKHRNESSSRSRSPSPTKSKSAIVYITDLPFINKNDFELADSIRNRLTAMFRIKVIDIRCYSKLGVGFIRVKNNEIKEHLVNTVGYIGLDSKDGSSKIIFSETLELVSYIVLDLTNEKDTTNLLKPDEVIARWIEISKGEKPQSCDQVNIQFPNIYRIIVTSLDDSILTVQHEDFAIKNRIARIYLGADCSYFEDLPRSITENQIREAICKQIGLENISPLSLYIELNKQANNACVIACDTARKWAKKSSLDLGNESISKKENLTCRLLLRSIPESFNIDTIVNHTIFNNKAKLIKYRGENLIIEISDKNIFDNCIKIGALRINDRTSLIMTNYTPFSDPEEREIDSYTWYESEMFRYKPDIMQFIRNPNHEIFHFKWNSQLWLEQFKRFSSHDQGASKHVNTRSFKNTSPDLIRHQLRVTVMLNTIATIRKKSYIVGNRTIELNLEKNLQTIIYNHQSKLQHGGPIPLKETPYKKTEIKVINEDCLVIYERLVLEGKKPLLLNMANATSPGGGYRKGDGAQEENLFRRSDYFRSLDVGLDDTQEDPCERSHCTSQCDLDSYFDSQKMYPMDEYGAIYTSGLTVFRQPENTGYEYMNKPLYGVCSLAMAAYRDPMLNGTMLAPKYAVGMRKKIENIFAIAYHNKHDSLVLSALGCGAFRNPPSHVAKLFHTVIEQYAGFFQAIIFAIIDDHNTGQQHNPQGNFKSFKEELDGLVIQPVTCFNQPNTMYGPYRVSSNGSTVKSVCIRDLPPCRSGATCPDMYEINHTDQFSHPSLCIQSLMQKCTRKDDNVHMSSFIHRKPCKDGAQCKNIKGKHAEEFEHPPLCPQGGNCQDTTIDHEKTYRHLEMCPYSHKCTKFRTRVKDHCDNFRHCIPICLHGSYCVNFHEKKHIDEYQHPFPKPCPFTPYQCTIYEKFITTKNPSELTDDVYQHWLDLSHVCPFGRNCINQEQLHWEKSIHIPRLLCPDGDKCKKLTQEDHLNSFTHPKIRDIRLRCKHADKCRDRRDPQHLSRYRHALTFEDSGVICYCNLNQKIDFVQNQKDNIARVTTYIDKNKWKSLPSGTIPEEIIDWIRTVQPVHRCSPAIFESIILHGHVMGREYMEHLKKPKFVANCVLEHSRIRRIKSLQIKTYAEHIRKYVTALITLTYEENRFVHFLSKSDTRIESLSDNNEQESSSAIIEREEAFLKPNVPAADMKAIREKAVEIAKASMKLFEDPAGIGYAPDRDLGTNKHVFSILGPHFGTYYGNVVIVFKREILHHPDANFSLQAATSYASGKTYTFRPWLGSIPSVRNEQIELFHKSKLHASVPGYEHATALELIAMTSHYYDKKSMKINLEKILKRWRDVDSHQVIEAHLPQLIPLDYIDHIYMREKIFNSLNTNTREVLETLFENHFTKVKGKNEKDENEEDKNEKEYNDFVIEELIKKFGQRDLHLISRPIQGIVMTIGSTNLIDHFILPLTISQAFTQYQINHPRASTNTTVYIYWQVMNGDMMLTLSNQQINPNKHQPDLKCLICYIAPKPVSNDLYYHEQASYLNSGHPSQHESFITHGKYAARSTAFYVGCNTDDLMTFCLEIERSTGKVTLSHAGPNSIYNHESISYQFPKLNLDLNRLEFIHVSAGARTIPIRNLIVHFEKQNDLHPTIDTKFEKITPNSSIKPSFKRQVTKDNIETEILSSSATTDDQSKNSSDSLTQFFKDAVIHPVKQGFSDAKAYFFGDNNSTLKPCSDGIYCLIQFSDDGPDHNSKYSHPCRFADQCRQPEEHLTHKPHPVPDCQFSKDCKQLNDPIHRSKYRHPGWSYFLIPCRDQKRCQNKSNQHRIKYSHGERVFETKGTADTQASTVHSSQHERESQIMEQDHSQQKPCRHGIRCRDTGDVQHCKTFSHPSATQQRNDQRIRCRWGTGCRDQTNHHRAKYSHPDA